MKMEIVATTCPECKSNNKETLAFGKDDFRYVCKDCKCMFSIHYDRVPTEVRIWKKDLSKPLKFTQEFTCEWIKNTDEVIF